MEFLKDYDCVINYHPGKANVVADALSRKSMYALKAMDARLSIVDEAIVAELVVKPNLVPSIIEAQRDDPKIVEWMHKVEIGKSSDFVKKEDGGLYFRGRLYVPFGNVREDI